MESGPARCYGKIQILCLSLLWLVILTTPSNGQISKRDVALCEKTAMNLILHPPPMIADRCPKTIVPTIGCRGHCNSYSKVDMAYPFEITRSCSCCTPTSFAIDLVIMRCKDGQNIRRPFRYARDCICRPCDNHDKYNAYAEVGLEKRAGHVWSNHEQVIAEVKRSGGGESNLFGDISGDGSLASVL
ncbi:bursicon-like [Lineus longissimus]|uniref:bursicon-like n=1 Tax=Lineus longissimus TaxID=88925 RepID=UPI002B4E43E7